VPDVPAELARIVHKAIENDPARRYQTARDLAVDLRRLEEPGARHATEAPVHTRARRTWRRPAFIAAAVLVIAAQATGYWWFRTRNAAIGSIAVIPIVNDTDASADYLADG